MPTSLNEVLLALAAPGLALLAAILWICVLAKRKGTTNLRLRCFGIVLDVKSCSLSETECRSATGLLDRRAKSDDSSMKGNTK